MKFHTSILVLFCSMTAVVVVHCDPAISPEEQNEIQLLKQVSLSQVSNEQLKYPANQAQVLNSGCPAEYVESLLNAINDFRAKYYVPKLSLADDLVASAQEAVEFNALNDLPGGEPHPVRPSVGSIYSRVQLQAPDGDNSPGEWSNNILEPSKFLDGIVANSEDYEWFGDEPPADKVAPFHDYAQLIWRSSERIGFGCAIASKFYADNNNLGHEGLPNGMFNNYHLAIHIDPPGNEVCTWRINFLPNCECDNWLWVRNASLDGSLTLTESCLKEREVVNASCPVGVINDLTAAINSLRAQHGGPSLVVSDIISEYSQEYLEDYLSNLEVNPNPYGESLVFISNNASVNPKDFIAQFNYDYQSYGGEPVDDSADDFTRLIWRRSRQIGYGCGLNGEGQAVIVVSIDPPGNQHCEYRPNVLPFVNSDLWSQVTVNGADNVDISEQCKPTPPPPVYCPCPDCPSSPLNYCPPDLVSDLLEQVKGQLNSSVKSVSQCDDLSDYSQAWADYLAARQVLANQPNNDYGQDFVYQFSIEDKSNYLANFQESTILGALLGAGHDPNAELEVGFGCASSASPGPGPYDLYLVINIDDNTPVPTPPPVVCPTTPLPSTTTSDIGLIIDANSLGNLH